MKGTISVAILILKSTQHNDV